MDFHNLAYWQEKANNIAIETRLFINGEYSAAADNSVFATVDPTAQQTLAEVARGKKADVDRAVQAARGVFDRGDWSQASPAQRKAVLHKFADLMEAHREELALLETLDTGKPIRHSLRDDVPGAARAIRWYAEAIDKVYGEVAPTGGNELAMIVREPIGVIAAVVPWNFPLLLACWKLGPALASGNSVVLKPSEKSPLTALRLAGLAKQAGLPDGVFNVVSGFGHEAGRALAQHHDVEVITFTGSTRTGKQLLKDAGDSNMKRVWLEAGGKSANIVFADCPDLQKAVNATAGGIFYNQGEVCCAGSRIIIEESIHDAFVKRFAERANAMTIGNPLDNPDMGPVVSESQLRDVLSYVQKGLEEGATLVCGGERFTEGECAKGYFMRPTIFDHCTPDMTIVREEIFGPVVTIQTFKTEEEAIAMANDTDYGLAGGVFTHQLERAIRVVKEVRAGITWVNAFNPTFNEAPWGGYKMSGIGRELGVHGLEEYQEIKQVNINLTPGAPGWYEH